MLDGTLTSRTTDCNVLRHSARLSEIDISINRR